MTTEPRKPSEVLKPYREAYNNIAQFSSPLAQSRHLALTAAIDEQHDSHAARLLALEQQAARVGEYLGVHAKNKACSTKYGIAEAARRYLSASPKPEPASEDKQVYGEERDAAKDATLIVQALTLGGVSWAYSVFQDKFIMETKMWNFPLEVKHGLPVLSTSQRGLLKLALSGGKVGA